MGWMQSTGQASTQAVSLVPMQGSAITYAIAIVFQVQYISQGNPETQIRSCQWQHRGVKLLIDASQSQKSRLPRRRPRHPLPPGHQGPAEGDAPQDRKSDGQGK